MTLATVSGTLAQAPATFGGSKFRSSPAVAPPEEMVSHLIVKPRSRTGDQLNAELHTRDAGRLTKMANRPLTVMRPMSGGAHVLVLDHPVPLSEARAIAARLMQDSSVELVEPDRFIKPQLVPNDPFYASQQWYIQPAASGNSGGANLPDAWEFSTGSNAIVVAVLDTGYYQHSDLATILPGYNFISNAAAANNGIGRSTDARDLGDWIDGTENTNAASPFFGCGVRGGNNNPVNQLKPSSWHGTNVTGIIAATLNNNFGIAGIAPNVRILPVRVVGKCGGTTSDIIDGMRWAAGLSVPGVPANPTPAKILNMSLSAVGNCSTAFQSAVTDVTNAGAILVAATGNGSNSVIDQPARCTGALAVTANAINGDNAAYANVGPQTFISAPGGGCPAMNFVAATNTCSIFAPGVYSLGNNSQTTPNAAPEGNAYMTTVGTSLATAHVSGVIALMLSVNPTLTPAQVRTYLQTAARPFPVGTYCTPGGGGNRQCGVGLLDAAQTLVLLGTPVPPPPSITLGEIPAVVTPGTLVTLSSSAVAAPGRTIVSYAWTQQDGPDVILNTPDSATATFIAPPTGTGAFTLTVTDDAGKTDTAVVVVRINSPPRLDTMPQQTVVAGQSLNFTVTATDADNDEPIFFTVSAPPSATLDASGNFSWPNAAPEGEYTLTYYATDNDANSEQGTVGITVTAIPIPAAAPRETGGGGGGSLGWMPLAALAWLAAVWRRYKNKNQPLLEIKSN
jgi:serine protease